MCTVKIQALIKLIYTCQILTPMLENNNKGAQTKQGDFGMEKWCIKIV